MFPKLTLFYFLFLTISKIFACDYYPRDSTRSYSTTVCTNISLSAIPDEDVSQFLEITQSKIATIPKSTFSKFLTLTKLYLTQNHIKEIEVGAFEGLENLLELHLDLNQLTVVENGVFSPLKSLEILNLANNKIEKVERNALKGLEALLEVNLENNKLHIIVSQVFASQKKLQLLDLSGNPLTKFEGEGLSSLSALILAETSLTQFESDLSHLKLEILNLSASHLQFADFSLFPKAEKVYLSNNELTGLTNLGSINSSYISLDNNQIVTINGTLTDALYITLKHNNLEILTDTIFNESASIRFIDLSYNEISTIESNTFQGLTALQILHLEYNNISELNPKLFTDLIDLTYLDLSHNNIKELQYGTFNNLIQLKVLNISDNKLKSLHENGLLAVISLEELIFHNNEISNVDVETLMRFKGQLKVVSLNHNAWSCDRVAEAYVRFMANHSINLPGLSEEGENFQGIACTSKKAKSLEGSEMGKFFNQDFKNSKFFKFFETDYKRSGFFKVLDGKITAEKMVSEQPRSDNINKILLLSVGIQVVIAILLLMNFLKRNRL